MKVPDHPADCSNLLLSRLPEDEYQRIRPHLEWVPCPLKSSFYKRGQPIEFVHFPLGGEHSVLTVMENGSAVEVGTVAYEGFSTIEALTGNRAALEDVTCQIPGEALRMPIKPFLAAVDGRPCCATSSTATCITTLRRSARRLPATVCTPPRNGSRSGC
jgi:hypothetical protein